MRLLLLCLVAAAPAIASGAPLPKGALATAVRVEARNGNIYAVDAAGGAVQLTASGADRAPVLSPRRDRVVFIRTDASRTDNTSLGDTPHQDILIARDGEEPATLVAGRGTPDMGAKDTLADFGDLLFSPDGATLYFTSTGWVTSTAAHAVDVATGARRFLTDGVVGEVIAKGRDAGRLRVFARRLDDVYPADSPKYRGRIGMEFIYTKTGKQVRRVRITPD